MKGQSFGSQLEMMQRSHLRSFSSSTTFDIDMLDSVFLKPSTQSADTCLNYLITEVLLHE